MTAAGTEATTIIESERRLTGLRRSFLLGAIGLIKVNTVQDLNAYIEITSTIFFNAQCSAGLWRPHDSSRTHPKIDYFFLGYSKLHCSRS